MRKYQGLLAVCLLLFAGVSAALEERVEKVNARGVETRFILTLPDGPPVASLVLFAGGHGKLGLGSMFGKTTFAWGEGNNLVRTREDYAKQGFLVATVDAPQNLKKMNAIWRMSSEHAEDIAAVVAFLRRQADVPVWAVGTSMGSFSAANMGARNAKYFRGLVLTSSVTRSRSKWKIAREYPDGVINMDLAGFGGPVMLVGHESDGCPITPPGDIDKLAAAFSSSSKVEKAIFSGGDTPRSKPCKALSYHGFYGIESQVVEAISQFVKANS